MPSARVLLSEAEYDGLPEQEGWKIELSHGELRMTASARIRHNRVRDQLGVSLTVFANARNAGPVFWETDFKLDDATVRIPNLAFLRAEHFAGLDQNRRPSGAPDLAVEVVSPSNDADDLALKAQQYLRAGAQLVWVLYPESRLAYIYRPGERPEVREDHVSLDAPELLPGWSLSLAKLFDASCA